MQLGGSASVPEKEPLRLGSSVVAGTQMMGNALLVRVSLRATSAERGWVVRTVQYGAIQYSSSVKVV